MANNVVEIILRGSDQSAKAIASSVKGLQGMDAALGAISRHLSGILSVGALVALGKSAIQLGSDLSDASKKFGVSASELSALQYVAKLSGVEFADLGGAFKFLSKAIAESQNPASDAAIAFKAMGINVRDANGNLKPTNALFMELADAFAGMKDGANKTALAMAIFGRSGANILPVMADGAAGINKLKVEAKSLGATLTEEEIANLDAYGDAIDRIGMVAKSTAGRLMMDMGDASKWLFRQNDIALNLVGKLNKAVSGGPSGVVQGKIADILVPNPEPAKKNAPNLEADKKAEELRAKQAKESQAEYIKMTKDFGDGLQDVNEENRLKSQGEMELWASGYRVRADEILSLMSDFSTSAKDPLDVLFQTDKAQQALQDWEDSYQQNLSNIAGLMADFGDDARNGFETAMTAQEMFEAAFTRGDVSAGIALINDGLGAQWAAIAEGQSYIDLYKTAWLDANLAVADSIASLYSGMQGWMSSSLQGLITGAMQVQDVMRNLGKMMLSIITDYVAKWLVSRLFMAVMGKSIAAAETAAMLPIAVATAEMWAPAAALASLATLGGNSVPATEGILATFGLTESIAAMTALGGAAHGGLDYVPAESTFLLQKGERVLSPRQNEDLTEFLRRKEDGERGSQTINVYLDGETLYKVIHRGVRTGQLNLRMT